MIDREQIKQRWKAWRAGKSGEDSEWIWRFVDRGNDDSYRLTFLSNESNYLFIEPSFGSDVPTKQKSIFCVRQEILVSSFDELSRREMCYGYANWMHHRITLRDFEFIFVSSYGGSRWDGRSYDYRHAAEDFTCFTGLELIRENTAEWREEQWHFMTPIGRELFKNERKEKAVFWGGANRIYAYFLKSDMDKYIWKWRCSFCRKSFSKIKPISFSISSLLRKPDGVTYNQWRKLDLDERIFVKQCRSLFLIEENQIRMCSDECFQQSTVLITERFKQWVVENQQAKELRLLLPKVRRAMRKDDRAALRLVEKEFRRVRTSHR